MSSEKLYSEIFEDFNKCETKKERIGLLRKFGDRIFINFLECAFNPNIEFDKESFPSTYRPAVEPAGLNFSYLNLEVPKLYRFIKNHPSRAPGLTEEKQRRLLVVVLESLHADEARILVHLFDKDLKVKHLTKNLVQEAFPEILI